MLSNLAKGINILSQQLIKNWTGPSMSRTSSSTPTGPLLQRLTDTSHMVFSQNAAKQVIIIYLMIHPKN